MVILGGGSTHALIPLYAVGVFIDFTIAQSGMVRHWLRTRDTGWRRRLSINAVGAVLTGVIAIVVTSVKFLDGAWFVMVLIPLLVGMMLFVRSQYDGQSHDLEVRDDLVFERPHREQRVIIPVNGINRAVVQAVMFGKSLASDASMLQAVYVTTDLEEAELLRVRWDRQLPGVPLVIVESPYRALVNPVVTYLDVLDHAWPPGKEAPTTIVVLPEYVARRWWDRLLYNQAAKRLKAALVGREHTVIADVPYRRSGTQPRLANPLRAPARGRPEHAHDRWTAPHEGSQARGPSRPRRAAALGLLPLHRPQPADREAGGERAADGARARLGPRRSPGSSAARWRARRRSASGCRSASPCRSSAPTRSRPPPTRRRRSCGSSSSAARWRSSSASRSRRRSRSCSRSSRSRTARSAGRSPTAAARTPSRARSCRRCSASSPRRRC